VSLLSSKERDSWLVKAAVRRGNGFADAPIHNFLDGIPEPEALMPATETTYAEMGRILSKEFEATRY
jgi:hypothetical protein